MTSLQRHQLSLICLGIHKQFAMQDFTSITAISSHLFILHAFPISDSVQPYRALLTNLGWFTDALHLHLLKVVSSVEIGAIGKLKTDMRSIEVSGQRASRKFCSLRKAPPRSGFQEDAMTFSFSSSQGQASDVKDGFNSKQHLTASQNGNCEEHTR